MKLKIIWNSSKPAHIKMDLPGQYDPFLFRCPPAWHGSGMPQVTVYESSAPTHAGESVRETPSKLHKDHNKPTCCNTYRCWYEPGTGRSGSRAHPLPAYCSWEWAWQAAALVESPLLLNVKITMLKSGDMVYMQRGRWMEWVREKDQKAQQCSTFKMRMWTYKATSEIWVRQHLVSVWSVIA